MCLVFAGVIWRWRICPTLIDWRWLLLIWLLLIWLWWIAHIRWLSEHMLGLLVTVGWTLIGNMSWLWSMYVAWCYITWLNNRGSSWLWAAATNAAHNTTNYNCKYNQWSNHWTSYCTTTRSASATAKSNSIDKWILMCIKLTLLGYSRLGYNRFRSSS